MFTNHNHETNELNDARSNIQLIHLTGCEKRYRPSKHYVYILEVHWSDAKVYQIYRKYSDFFKFHVSLFELFPEESGKYDTTKRILPFLPGRKLFQEEVEKIATKRQVDLDAYCRDLMTLDGRISQHQHVKKFFEARKEDLSPPIDARMKPERSILMKTLELIPFMTGKPRKKHSCPQNIPRSTSMPLLDVPEDSNMSISDPIILQTYRAIADYKGDIKADVSFLKDQLIDVIEKNNNGWWFVQNEYGQGWAPASYLDPVTHETEIDAPEPLLNYEQYLVLKDYQADLNDEITIKTGAIVNVMHKLLDGWWIIHHNGRVGYVPATYLVPYGSCGSLHTGRTGSNASFESTLHTPVKSPTQRRCTIKSRKISDKEQQKSSDHLSMCRKISVKLEQRQHNMQPKQALREPAPTTPKPAVGDEGDDGDDDDDYENGDVTDHIGQSRILGLNAVVPCNSSEHSRVDRLKQFVPALGSRVPATVNDDALDYEIVDEVDIDYLHPTGFRELEQHKLKAEVAAPQVGDPVSTGDRCRDYYNSAVLVPRDNDANSLSTAHESPVEDPTHVYQNGSFLNYENMSNLRIKKHRQTLEPPNHPINRKTMMIEENATTTDINSESSIQPSPKPTPRSNHTRHRQIVSPPESPNLRANNYINSESSSQSAPKPSPKPKHTRNRPIVSPPESPNLRANNYINSESSIQSEPKPSPKPKHTQNRPIASPPESSNSRANNYINSESSIQPSPTPSPKPKPPMKLSDRLASRIAKFEGK